MIHADSPLRRKKSPLRGIFSRRLFIPPLTSLLCYLSILPPFHSLSPLFKCCASWIPAVQSASAGEIEFTRNLVLSPFVCVICWLEVWPPRSLARSYLKCTLMYFLKIWKILIREQALTRKPLHETKVLFLNALCNGLQMSSSSAHKSWVTLHLQVHFVVCVSSPGCQICAKVAK